MSRVIVGKWGKNLAVRVPFDVARAAGLTDGEHVEIEAQDGDLIIRRPASRARALADAQTAADEIMAESKSYSLGDAAIRELLEDGRRG